MCGTAVQLGGKLDPADEFHPGLARDRNRCVEALEGIVVRDPERSHAGAYRFLN
jgi:hypothetical protein